MSDENELARKIDAMMAEIAKRPSADVIFSTDDAKALQEVANVARQHPGALMAWAKLHAAFSGIGMIGNALMGVVKWLVVIIGAWLAFQTFLLETIRQALEKGGNP